MKIYTITSIDNTLLNKDSKFIIHTATSCGLIDEIKEVFYDADYKTGLKKAEEICKKTNEENI